MCLISREVNLSKSNFISFCLKFITSYQTQWYEIRHKGMNLKVITIFLPTLVRLLSYITHFLPNLMYLVAKCLSHMRFLKVIRIVQLDILTQACTYWILYLFNNHSFLNKMLTWQKMCFPLLERVKQQKIVYSFLKVFFFFYIKL